MGFRIVTDDWIKEITNERDSYKIGLEKMEREHNRALAWAREIRDKADGEIELLHLEIEALKKDRAQLRTENNRLRSCVKYYEQERKNGKNKASV